MYNSIAMAPSCNSTKCDSKTSEDQLSSKLAAVASPSWDNLPPEEGKKSRETTASWSERAGLGEAASQAYRTPDASPQQAHQLKELELSWSERRGASPLTKVKSTENEYDWKRPAERKRKLKKKSRNGTSEDEKGDKEEQDEEDKEKSGQGKKEKDDKEEVTASGDDDKDVSAELKMNVEKEDQNKAFTSESFDPNDHEPSSQDTQACVSIEKRMSSTDSSVSGGFEPSLDASADLDHHDDDENMECEAKASDERRVQGDITHVSGEEMARANDVLENASAVQEKRENCFLHDEDEDSKDSSSVVNVDKYHMLLDVLREFLIDFFDDAGRVSYAFIIICFSVIVVLWSVCHSNL